MAPPAPAGPATISKWMETEFVSEAWNSETNRCVVYLRAVGGESASPATLAPKVGPLGMVLHVLVE